MSHRVRLHASTTGSPGAPALLFVHGFGCAQQVWRHVAPAFEVDHEVTVYDLAGSGRSEASYDAARYATLDAHARDLVELCEELGPGGVTVVGHSVAAMIAVLAHLRRPDLLTRLVLVAPSARYVDEGDYHGGFLPADVEELLELIDTNHLGWQRPLAELVAGGPPALVAPSSAAAELEDSFCRMRPDIARHFAEVTFRGDNRADLGGVVAPTLVLQSRIDVLAPMTAGVFVRDHIASARFVVLDTVGHCPHLTAPQETVAAIRAFLDPPAT